MHDAMLARCEHSLGEGDLALSRADHRAAEAAFQAAIAEAEQLDRDSEQCAAGWSGLGRLRYHEKRYGEAVAAFRRALEIRERLLGPEHVGTVETLRQLAAACAAHGELDE